jgi:NADH-quinone oxidoreductase E subunit
MAQNKFGWLSTEVKEYVADLLGLSFAHVHGVASFYTMYFKKPMGKYHIQVCTNVSCMLRKGEEIYEHVSKRLGIKNNEATPDGLFSLEEVECMGACGGAPMIAVNEDFYENIDIHKVDELLNSLK